MITIQGNEPKSWIVNKKINEFIFRLANARLQQLPEMETRHSILLHKECSRIEDEDLLVN